MPRCYTWAVCISIRGHTSGTVHQVRFLDCRILPFSCIFGMNTTEVFAFPSCTCLTILCYGHGMLRCIQFWQADTNGASISVTVKLCYSPQQNVGKGDLYIINEATFGFHFQFSKCLVELPDLSCHRTLYYQQCSDNL